MRLSTSPVGPMIVVAMFCAVMAAPAWSEPNNAATAADVSDAAGVERNEGYAPVAPSAWSFLTEQNAVAASDLPPPEVAAPSPPAASLDGDAPEKPLSDEERQKLNQALATDYFDFGDTKSAPLRKRHASDAPGLNVSRNGTNTVVFDKPIVPSAGQWNAKLGADLGMSADQVASANADNPLRVQQSNRNSDAAWASFGLSAATVDARVNAGNDQGLVATTFKHSVPIGSALSLTLQSRTSVTERFGQGTTSFDIPMMALPVNDAAAVGSRVWGQENSAKFNIPATGTSFAAGVSATSADTVSHNTLSAEQKVYGPLQVSTSITDVGQTSENKSVNARFKFNW
ncbi:MAG: hypothetical protein JSR72_13130 [Proteobacteria bacterium]|nr:hypothetical protein [Pseudomonadota bacterium]